MADESVDLVVIGGGAAGLATAIAAGEALAETARIVVLDGAKRLGAKILVSGGGRCNVTHHRVTPQDFFGNRHIIKNVLAAFPVQATIDWLASLGVPLKQEDTGKLFPVTDRSRTVLEALIGRCGAVRVDIRTNHRVTGLERRVADSGALEGFAIRHTEGIMTARLVVLATGGRSLPKSGSDGFGYHLAGGLGHDVTRTVPALVPLELESASFHPALAGVSQEVELTTAVEGRTVDCRRGSLLWTHTGISGPVVMDASRVWTQATGEGKPVALYGNFLPGRTGEQVRGWLGEQAAAHPRRALITMLSASLPDRMAAALCRNVGCDPQHPMGQLSRSARQQVTQALTRYEFPVAADRGWNYAEVTAGGVPLEQVNFRTLESKLVPGLYLVGEILDCDGRIGGFNFQWAWSTGALAGRAAARVLSGISGAVDREPS